MLNMLKQASYNQPPQGAGLIPLRNGATLDHSWSPLLIGWAFKLW